MPSVPDNNKLMSKAAWQVEIDCANAEQWSQMLEMFSDANLYQTASYGEVRWGEKNISRIVLKRDGEVVSIAQLRIVRPSPLKYGMAYLRWGPLWERKGISFEPEISERMVRAITDEYLAKRNLFLRVLPNAFQGSSRALAVQAAFSAFTPEPPVADNRYRTFLLSLEPELDELRKGLDKKWRNQLSQAERNSLEITSATGADQYRVFVRIYEEMRRRKSFRTKVDVEEFGRIQESLPESQRMHTLICSDKGVPVAGVVVSVMGESAIYLLGATSNDGMNSKGAYLLHWRMIQWLKERKVKWYDLGGIDPKENPGVYHFKRGFSGNDVCHISTLVASESRLSSAMVNIGIMASRALEASKQALRPRRIDQVGIPN